MRIITGVASKGETTSYNGIQQSELTVDSRWFTKTRRGGRVTTTGAQRGIGSDQGKPSPLFDALYGAFPYRR